MHRLAFFVLALTLATPSVANAAAYTATFSGWSNHWTLSPWIVFHGSNWLTGSAVHSEWFSEHVTPSAGVSLGLDPYPDVEISMDVVRLSGGVGLTLKRNGATGEHCGFFVWDGGDTELWLSGTGNWEQSEGSIAPVPMNQVVTIEATLDPSGYVEIFADSAFVWSGTHPMCGFAGDGTLGWTSHANSGSEIYTFSATWSTGGGDLDGDGFLAPTDCDDNDDTVYPGAFELCDAIDSDCDSDWVDGYPDSDGDGDPDCIDPVIPSGDDDDDEPIEDDDDEPAPTDDDDDDEPIEDDDEPIEDDDDDDDEPIEDETEDETDDSGFSVEDHIDVDLPDDGNSTGEDGETTDDGPQVQGSAGEGEVEVAYSMGCSCDATAGDPSRAPLFGLLLLAGLGRRRDRSAALSVPQRD